MYDFIRRALTLARVLTGPGRGRRRAGAAPLDAGRPLAARRFVTRAVGPPHLHPPGRRGAERLIDGNRSPLVRPYLVACEQQERTDRGVPVEVTA